MKKHTTMTITVEMLDALNPCPSGRAAALPFLPAKVSTDPEQNIDLALEIVDAPTPPADARWLMNTVLDSEVSICCGSCDHDYHYDSRNVSAQRETSDDPLLVAQYLAWVADVLATRAGR